MCAFSDQDFQVYKQRSNVRERFKCIDLWVSLTSEGVMLIGVPVKVVFKLAVPIDGPD
jgi:hypothetical protein